MSSLPCAFCEHVNPGEAKFCNACGSPLSLRPCAACDAVNEAAASACYKCGAALRQAEMGTPASAAAYVPEPVVAVSEVEHAPSHEPTADIFGVFERPSPGGETERPVIGHRDQRDWREYVFGVLPAGRQADGGSSSTTTSAFADGPAAVLHALLIATVVVGIVVSAYYAYHSPVLAGTWLHGPRPGGERVGSQSDTPAADVGKAPPAEHAAIGKSDATAQVAGAPSEVGSRRDPAAASTPRKAADGTDEPDTTAPGAHEPPVADPSATPQTVVPPSDASTRANATQRSATQPRAPAARPGSGAARAASDRGAFPSANTLMPSARRDAATRKSPGSALATPCTDAVAALGFCDRPPRGESR